MIRQWLLGSAAGRLALSLRDGFDLLTAGREEIGAVANDQLAGMLVARLTDEGGTFIDIGAHIGSVIAAVRRHSPGATIVAVEAIPEKAERLRAKFPGVRVECCALAEREGTARFFIDLDRSGYSSLAKGEGRQREIEVPLRTLDGLIADGRADVIKIDVEGAELGVLRGAVALLEASRPLIMFESGPHEVLGHGKEAMWRFLRERDYAVFAPNRLAHEAPPFSVEGFLDSHHYPRRTTNYFAVPLEKIEAIRAKARKILNIR
ncbi:FkbM family methyltransferase [Sphingomonas sp. SRS2]|uniref:FkbM family methyltransferase n=1 Tax=Sphingomonas sp. SRS2 TaxID=133190 RepID=UPI0006184AEE|nr:FkbM family methyltransferase [Sphingomonas sp. SRS2]KKC25755.1 hypothetical protein WP12_11865 [Sphingomonas sp. SRS2]